jgi:hypothetical protein
MTTTTHVDGAEDAMCPTCGSSIFASVLTGEEKEPAPPKQRKPRHVPAPGVTKIPEVRRAVRIECLAKIPGCNRPIAAAILAVFPTSTFSRITAASVDDLANIQIRHKTLGRERASAIKNVVR